jgi:hypothetical protein
MPLLEQMAGFISIAASLFFVYIIREMIRAAEQSGSMTHIGWAAGLFAGSMVGVSFYYTRRMNRVAKAAQPR